ncbi:MAG TPA: tRNA (adenosine(37)-N6)-threonylcarbamoyltransferase complex dimerization subunit type 1 TsaB [Gemmatimonadaceae bacterium]|nr:tRNA (adenosine(37)-N6)-threonylcarbamoyltransferase complex dimerization subunit type 1 TsaB [Gemmatimonadaceae bacterium]
MSKRFTLALEGSTYEGSVALIRGAEAVAERTLRADDGGGPGAGRGERLLPAIAECMADARVGRADIKHVVCGAGPGSFTSLRVAAAVAKGLAVGYGADLYAVSSLVLTLSGARSVLVEGEYLSVLDAMRGEWFAARVRVSGGKVEQTAPAAILSAEDLHSASRSDPQLRIIGPGQQIDGRPHARGVAPLLRRILSAGPVDLASWEPDYGRLPEAQVKLDAARNAGLHA